MRNIDERLRIAIHERKPRTLHLNHDPVTAAKDVLREVVELFPGEYVHLGGDEVVTKQWLASERIAERLRELVEIREAINYAEIVHLIGFAYVVAMVIKNIVNQEYQLMIVPLLVVNI